MLRFLEAQGIAVHTIGSKALESEHHHVVEITNAAEIGAVLQSVRPDCIFHLAGVVRHPDPQVFYRVNTQYAVALLTALETNKLQIPTLLVGTAAEYGQPTPAQLPIREDMPPNPLEHYGISKLAQTLAALAAHKRSGLPIVVARPSNIIGAGMPQHFVVQSFASQIAAMQRGEIVSVLKTGNLASSRDFIDVSDMARIYWDLLQTPKAFGEVVNVCAGVATPIAAIVGTLTKLSGLDITVETDPALMRPVDVPVHYGSVEKLLLLLGYAPQTDLEASLEAILKASNKNVI